MQRLLTDPLDLAAASPFVASTPSTNNGTVAVNALRMVATPTDIQGEVTVTFTGADPSNPARFLYDWELRDDVQQACRDLWPQITSENLSQLTDYQGYKDEFLKLFGFGWSGVDYGADVATEVNFDVIELM